MFIWVHALDKLTHGCTDKQERKLDHMSVKKIKFTNSKSNNSEGILPVAMTGVSVEVLWGGVDGGVW